MRYKYDYSKLRGRIIEKFGTCSAFADALHTSNVQISAKLNGKTDITKDDIESWSELLRIRPEDYGTFYFTKKVE